MNYKVQICDIFSFVAIAAKIIDYLLNHKLLYCQTDIFKSSLLFSLSLKCTFIFSLVKYTPLKFNNTYEYPWWGYTIGGFFTLSSTLLVPLWMLYAVCVTPGTLRQVQSHVVKVISRSNSDNRIPIYLYLGYLCLFFSYFELTLANKLYYISASVTFGRHLLERISIHTITNLCLLLKISIQFSVAIIQHALHILVSYMFLGL